MNVNTILYMPTVLRLQQVLAPTLKHGAVVNVATSYGLVVEPREQVCTGPFAGVSELWGLCAVREGGFAGR